MSRAASDVILRRDGDWGTELHTFHTPYSLCRRGEEVTILSYYVRKDDKMIP